MNEMVKSIQISVDDDVHEKLVELKGDKTWLQFLVEPLISDTEGNPYRAKPRS